jgi:hypothetical protein
LREDARSIVARHYDFGRRGSQGFFPGFDLDLGRSAHEGGISLLQKAAIAADAVDICRPKKEYETIKEGPAAFWRTGDQIAVLGGQREDWEVLEVALDIDPYAVDAKISGNRRSNLHDVFEAMVPAADRNLALESKALAVVVHDLSELGGAEGPQIPEYHEGFEEAGFAGAVGTQHDIGGGAEAKLLSR